MKFPEKCPYCGKDNVQHKIITAPSKRITDTYGYGAELHECVHCHQPIFLFQRSYWHNTIYAGTEIIQYFPIATAIEYPESVKQLSPSAYEVYKQTLQAEAYGLHRLIGAGLRIALEHLVWDYLIKVQQVPEAKIKDLLLYQRIKMLKAPLYSKVCVKLIQLYGNGEVHIFASPDFSADEALKAYQMLCHLIDSETELIQPALKRLKDQHKQI